MGFFDALVNLKNNADLYQQHIVDRHFQNAQRQASENFESEQAAIAFDRQKELTNMQAQLSLQNQLDLERQTPAARLQGLKEAGMNLGLAGNMGGAGSAGVATPSVPQAHATQGNSPNSLSQMPISAGGIGEIMDIAKGFQEIQNMKAEEQRTEAETSEILGETKPAEAETAKRWADAAQANQAAAESTAKIGVYGKQKELLESDITWQNIQNEIAHDTKGSQKATIQRQAKLLKTQYELLAQEKKHKQLENESYEDYINSLINVYFAQFNEAMARAANLDIDTQYQDYTFTARQELLGWQGVNEMEFGERFKAQLEAELRAQNIQIAKEVIDAIVGTAGAVIRAKAVANVGKAMRRQTTITREAGDVINGRFKPNKASRKYIRYE